MQEEVWGGPARLDATASVCSGCLCPTGNAIVGTLLQRAGFGSRWQRPQPRRWHQRSALARPGTGGREGDGWVLPERRVGILRGDWDEQGTCRPHCQLGPLSVPGLSRWGHAGD